MDGDGQIGKQKNKWRWMCKKTKEQTNGDVCIRKSGGLQT